MLTHTGFLFPVPDPELAAVAIAEFLTTPVDWYFLALRTSRHARVSLRGIKVPAEFVAATFDVLAGARDMKTAADRVEERDLRRAARQPLHPDGAAGPGAPAAGQLLDRVS